MDALLKLPFEYLLAIGTIIMGNLVYSINMTTNNVMRCKC